MKRLFGGEDDSNKSKAPAPPGRPKPPTPAAEAKSTRRPPSERAENRPDLSGASAKELSRQLGSSDANVRREAASRLMEMGDQTSMRPLMTSYLNFGDPEVLEALRGYGSRLTPAVGRDAEDVSVVSKRRVRVIDMLVITGDEDALPSIRPSTDDPDLEVHVRACSALVELGDRSGIDLLAHDLHLTDTGLRKLALDALKDIDDPEAKRAIDEHIERYLAEAGAIPKSISVSAPRLEQPEASLLSHLVDHVKASPHSLTVITGSEAISMATGRRSDIEDSLAEYGLRITTRRAPPEEQIGELEAARDAASASPASRQILFGAIPAPRDQVPLPHFLVRKDGEYTAKIILVDPHELGFVMGWWHYVDDKSEVPTDFEVILAISTPERSAISEEEMAIYRLLPEDQRSDFVRAFLAHI